MKIFDLLIIGGGPAGYLAAERASKKGMDVILFEERRLGGVCLNEGCIPTKTLLNSSKILDSIKNASKYGIKVSDFEVNHLEILKRKRTVINSLVMGIESKLNKNKVTIISGQASIVGKDQGSFSVSANNTTYHSKKILIASGSEPVIPNIDGLMAAYHSGFVVTTREILELENVPERLAIIGGGVIGLEMASYFNSIGCKVVIFEMLDHIAGHIEKKVGKVLEKNMRKKGIEIYLSARVNSIVGNRIHFEHQGIARDLDFDRVLISVGRKPRVHHMGLESIGLSTESGRIDTDEHMCTKVPGVYAAGDINGISMLAHTAYREAEVAVNHMIGRQDRIRYHAIPSVIYTNPEVACVGETEETAIEKGMLAKTIAIPMKYSGRYQAEVENGDGICQVVFDTQNDRILGIHMVGSYVSEIIYGASILIETELCVEDIQEIVFPHPTIGEIIHESLFEY